MPDCPERGAAADVRAETERRVCCATTDDTPALIGCYRSRSRALEGFAGHGEQVDVRVRRHGGQSVPHAAVAEPLAA